MRLHLRKRLRAEENYSAIGVRVILGSASSINLIVRLYKFLNIGNAHDKKDLRGQCNEE